MATLKLRITGLATAQDEANLEAALRAEAGVFGAAASRGSGCAEIDYEDDEVAIERLIALVEQAGFGARLAG